MDGQPAHLFFLILAPGSSTGAHLKVLAKVSRLLKDDSFREKLWKAQDRESIYELIASKDQDF
jgi:PTS system nitrogen regulatory IIA component